MNSNTITTASSNDSFLCARYMVSMLYKLFTFYNYLYEESTINSILQMRSKLKEAKELGQNYSF